MLLRLLLRIADDVGIAFIVLEPEVEQDLRSLLIHCRFSNSRVPGARHRTGA
jgi:hypothetical protein